MKRLAIPAATLAVLALGPGSALAATLVVDDDAAQCPDATSTTINGAVAAAAPGDTIKVCAGTYHETVGVDKPLTFQGAQAGKDARHDRNKDAKESIVDSPTGGFVLTSSANDVTIDGFTIRNANAGAVRGISAFAGSSGLHVLDDVIEHNSGGVNFANASTDPAEAAVFRFNRFDSNTAFPDDDSGIFACCGPANDVVIDSNLFTGHVGDNGGNATAINNAAPPDANWLISNNDSIDDDTFAVLTGTTNAAIVGNSIVKRARKGPGLSGSGILIGGDNNGVLVKDNRIADGDATGIRVQNFFGGPDLNVFIRGNDIDKRLNGVRVGGAENGVDVEDNHVTNATNDGFLVESNATNTFLGSNKAESSGNLDCEDQTHGTGTSGTASTWKDDKGKKASPPGICKK